MEDIIYFGILVAISLVQAILLKNGNTDKVAKLEKKKTKVLNKLSKKVKKAEKTIEKTEKQIQKIQGE